MNPQQPPMQPLPPVSPQSQPNGYPPMPSQDPYHFIMEPPKPAKAPRSGILGNPFIVKILFILGGAMVLIMALTIIVNIFFGGKTNVQDLVLITETQQEMIRVNSQGLTAGTQAVKNAAATTEVTIGTQQREWLNYLALHGRKVPTKELNLKKDKTTDTRLTQAKATSTFDSAVTQVMRSQLTAYSSALSDAYKNASGQQEKNLLAKHYKDVQLLLEMWPKNVTP